MSRDLHEEEQDLEILTARFVHDWRIKTRGFKNGKEQKQWLRRGRLVAREFANTKRDDIRSVTSSAHALRLLPVMFLMDRGLEFSKKTSVMGSLDIKDAFRQVDQKKELQVTMNLGGFRASKNSPGQRQGAQAWFNHLVEFLGSIGFELCRENACLGRRADQVFVLIHVDDILYYGQEEAIQHFIGQLREKIEISVSQKKIQIP